MSSRDRDVIAAAYCKHCGMVIRGSHHAWVHTEGPQRGKNRCAIEPYGFDAAPEGEDCSFACRGSIRVLCRPEDGDQ